MLAYSNFIAILVLPKTAGSAQTHKSMSFIWIVWSTLYVYLCIQDQLYIPFRIFRGFFLQTQSWSYVRFYSYNFIDLKNPFALWLTSTFLIFQWQKIQTNAGCWISTNGRCTNPTCLRRTLSWFNINMEGFAHWFKSISERACLNIYIYAFCFFKKKFFNIIIIV